MAHGSCQYDNNRPSYPDKIPKIYGRDLYLIEVPAFDFHRALVYRQRAVRQDARVNIVQRSRMTPAGHICE